ncbi:MAG: type I pullulanase [Acidobacteria bacterium]|nr:type I pullulanase [Acidobacteriota bacterium]
MNILHKSLTNHFKQTSLLLLFFLFLILCPSVIKLETNQQLSHPADKFICTQELGAIYSKSSTTFRVFAPTAEKLVLRLYQTPTKGNAEVFSMSKNNDGSWEVLVSKDCLGLYYTFTASGNDPGFDPNRELIDPFARAVTAHNGRAIVVYDDFKVSPRPQFPIADSIIYEMHIRDFTIDPDSTIQQRGKYLSFIEEGTSLYQRPDISTGLDHLVELGINTVQVMPVMEFQNQENIDQYGWGYDSVHFNSPENSYSINSLEKNPVRELKQMVDMLHKKGIKVILDVVYNHTMEDIKGRVYSFEGLVPGYYYRRKMDGSYWNGSGVGNEFRSEAPMARRFIIDSVKYWVNEYGVDGFRFDLMGLIDLETMKEIVQELHKIDKNILVYGEPWSAGETPLSITNKGKQRSLGFSVFNDNFRDALKGSVFQARERGYIQTGNNIEKIKIGIVGSTEDFTDNPQESLNYVECHDNHTFWDRLMISTFDDSSLTDADRRAMARLGAAILFTSQGLPFFQSGQEFLRSKGGDENSYNKSDALNMIRWREKATNYDIYRYYQGLIKLRKNHLMFRMTSKDEIKQAIKFLDQDLNYQLPKGVIAYLITDVTGKDSWQRALVLLNASNKTYELNIPEGNWQVFVNQFNSGNEPISQVKSINKVIEISKYSALVLAENRTK